MAEPILLTTAQMASFAARGFLRLDAVVPNAVNDAFLDQVHHLPASEVTSIREHYGRVMTGSAIPIVAAGTPLSDAYPADSPLRQLLDVPEVAGALHSLVGPDPAFDHHFLHITYPPDFYRAQGTEPASQPYHQDSTIDPRRAFDVQLMYFPTTSAGRWAAPGSCPARTCVSSAKRPSPVIRTCAASSMWFVRQARC